MPGRSAMMDSNPRVRKSERSSPRVTSRAVAEVGESSADCGTAGNVAASCLRKNKLADPGLDVQTSVSVSRRQAMSLKNDQKDFR